MENFHSLCLRRFTTFAICVALLGCAVFAAPVEKAYAAPQNTITGDQAHIKVATVKSGTLNVRAAASTSSALKGKLQWKLGVRGKLKGIRLGIKRVCNSFNHV